MARVRIVDRVAALIAEASAALTFSAKQLPLFVVPLSMCALPLVHCRAALAARVRAFALEANRLSLHPMSPPTL